MFLILTLSSIVALIAGYPGPLKQRDDTDINKGWATFLEDEISTFFDIPLIWSLNSTVPEWIKGSYIKNGPARKKFGDDRHYSSWMDSWGKLHKFTFDGANVSFSGRMIETGNYNKSVEKGKMVPTVTLAPVLPNDWTMMEQPVAVSNLYDNTNVMLWKLGATNSRNGTYIATTDFPVVHEIDPDTLAVKQKLGMNMMTDGISMQTCSHFKREAGKDTSINFHMMYNPITLMPDFVLFRFGNNWEEREIVGKFPMDHLSLVHMFSNTVNYAVIAIYPVSMDFWALPTNNMHPFDTITKIDAPTKFYLINLNDGSVIDGFESWDSDLVFSTHHMNAWEEGNEVVFDLSCNPWDIMASFMDIETMINHPMTDDEKSFFVMKRVRLNLASKEVTVEDWPNQQEIPLLNTVDFPMINENYVGYKNRYAYGWASIDYWRQTLVKKDLENSINDKTWSRPSHYPGEVFFIPRPGGVDEDDGVIVTVVFDGEKEQTYLLLLDGTSFTEINYSYLPYNVPFSFHGNWFPGLY